MSLFLSSILSIAVRLIGTASGFILTLLITKSLGAAESGLYFLSFAIVTFLAVFSRLGLDMVVIKKTGSELSSHNTYTVLNKALIVTTSLSLFFTALLFFGSDYAAEIVFNKPELGEVLSHFSFAVFGIAVLAILSMSMQGRGNSIASVMVQTVVLNMILICYVAVTREGNDAINLATLYSITGAGVFSICYLLWVCRLKNKSRINKGACKDLQVHNITYYGLLTSSLPLWIFTMANQLVQWSGLFFVGAFATSANVAEFGVSQKIANLLTVLFMAINMVVAPKLAHAFKKENNEEVFRLMKQSTILATLVSALPMLVFAFYSRELLGLFGKDFEAAGPLLLILFAGYFYNVATGPIEILLSMSNQERVLKIVALYITPFSILLSAILTIYFGVLGAAIATSLTLFLQKTAIICITYKKFKLSPFAIWFRKSLC